MNGDDKEEAHRPRPLSAGIWTLFSWLRRSERSSSSDSISSVGSARTAVSFDFLAPGHCNLNKTPVVLSTPLSPPTETYKKRLQERNLRRQRDRDITLHRKYGLFREHGSGYDGYSLPPARRVAATVDRQNRERRANSECLQRRAAYVPGKRRAPLPPALLTSASLPRNYKRKRPAPKPPVTKTVELKVEEQVNLSTRMSSSARSEENERLVFDVEVLTSSKTEKYDRRSTDSKDYKSRTEKSFLKSIFENKRKSTSEVTTVRLLPSISELDKQAAEIIENNKFRQSRNYNSEGNAQSSTAYEGNAWFCTSCLRKYSSSVNSCNYCHNEKKSSVIDIKKSDGKSPNSRSFYTQTNNGETSCNRNSTDERQILKEILKEMKDSLPKKHRDPKLKVNNLVTETPTLRIGSTVHEEYKDLTSQASSSSEICHNKIKESTEKSSSNRILFVSSLLSDSTKNFDQGAKRNDDHQTSNPAVTTEFKSHENKNIQSSSLNLSASSSDKLPNNHQSKENCKTRNELVEPKGDTKKEQGRKNTPISEEKNVPSSKLQMLPDLEINKNTNKQLCLEINTNESKKTSNDENNISLIAQTNNESAGLDKNKLTSYKPHFISKNNKFPTKMEISKDCIINHVSASNITKEHVTSNQEIKKVVQKSESADQNINMDLTHVKTECDVISSQASTNVLPLSTLHTPLKISTLLNPLYSPKLPVINEGADNAVKNKTNIQNIDEKQTDEKVVKESLSKQNLHSPQSVNDLLPIPHKKDIKKIKPTVETVTEKLNNQNTPSTSNCFPKFKNNDNIENLDRYDRRRLLINQLEQSIAKGDETAAADAAIKLAKLKLSCSVLSFSSQIVGESPTSEKNISKVQLDAEKESEIIISNTAAVQNVALTTTAEIKNGKNETSAKVHATDYNKNIESSTSNRELTDDVVSIEVWIEDKQAERGPVKLHISRRASMADLRRRAEHSLGLVKHLQRWIIGRTLCTDDTTSLVSLAGPDLRAPFYLCVVQSETSNRAKLNDAEINSDKDNEINKNNEFYNELLKLEHQSLVANIEPFECGVCMEECAVGAGVVLRECIHTFCRGCLSDVVQHCQEPAVSCPAMGCSGFLQEREIRTIVSPEEYERWLARSLATVECGTRNAFHCRTRDCTGWAFCDPGVRRFPCPVCKHTNCVQCQALHEGETCEQYQVKLREAVTAAETYKDDEGTQALLNSLLSRGEALECPECKAIITKKWGCDWVKCSACKTEICWATKGRRWGPGGRGDTSAGCRCGVDGQRCHPSCGYCH